METVHCPICGGSSNFFTKKRKGKRHYIYYACDNCGSLFIDPEVLEAMDSGKSIVDYRESYWDAARLRGGEKRVSGPCLARMAEVFFYTRRPIRRFLDIGGGNGRFLDYVAKYLPSSKECFYSVEKYPPPKRLPDELRSLSKL